MILIKIWEQLWQIQLMFFRNAKNNCDVNTYIKLSLEEMEILIAKIKSELSEVVGRYKSNNLCSAKEKEFLLSKMFNFTVPHFYIIWKF